MSFRVWEDGTRTKCDVFESVTEAVNFALQQNRLITQDVPLGDPVVMLVEDLAFGTPEFEVPDDIKQAAIQAVRERRKFDFHKGR